MTEVLPEWAVSTLEMNLTLAARMLQTLDDAGVRREWEEVFRFLSDVPPAEMRSPVTKKAFVGKDTWASTAGDKMDATIARFTSLSKSELVLHAFVEHFKEEQEYAASNVHA